MFSTMGTCTYIVLFDTIFVAYVMCIEIFNSIPSLDCSITTTSNSSIAIRIMFRLCATNVARVAARPLALSTPVIQSPVAAVAALTRFQLLSTVADCATANDALKYSGYSEIDFTISEDANVYDAVQKFAAFNIGCLVTTDAAGNMTGVVSERDYICKIALLGRTSKTTPIKEISTRGPNIITAEAGETVEDCMEKMMSKGIRHLPIVDAQKNVIGMISIKDLVKTVLQNKEETIKVLSNFALGRGGHYGSD